MKKIIFILLILTLLVTACSVETTDTQETISDNQGYIEDLDQELDNSDLDDLDNDLNNLDWI